jgi:hypothetical protein
MEEMSSAWHDAYQVEHDSRRASFWHLPQAANHSNLSPLILSGAFTARINLHFNADGTPTNSDAHKGFTKAFRYKIVHLTRGSRRFVHEDQWSCIPIAFLRTPRPVSAFGLLIYRTHTCGWHP